MSLPDKVASFASIIAVGMLSVTGVALADPPVEIRRECVDTNNRANIRDARNRCDDEATAGVPLSICDEGGLCTHETIAFSVGIFRPENPTDTAAGQTLPCVQECSHDGTCTANEPFVCEGAGKQTTPGLRPE
jgi:hypothetical protein